MKLTGMQHMCFFIHMLHKYLNILLSKKKVETERTWGSASTWGMDIPSDQKVVYLY
jgi:hypothetical protein